MRIRDDVQEWAEQCLAEYYDPEMGTTRHWPDYDVLDYPELWDVDPVQH